MSAAASIPVIVLLLTFGFLIGTSESHNRPIIGIVAQETSNYMKVKYNGTYDSYIAASYVKFVEGAGGRVVPIWIGQSNAYYKDIMGKINGVLWPGGVSSFNFTGKGYAEAASKMYKIAKEMNDKDTYFPIFAICLGFELLAAVTANYEPIRRKCNSENQTVHLNFTRSHTNSKLFGNASSDVLDILKEKDVTANFHKHCVTENALQTAGAKDKFRVLSLNHAYDGVEFISSLESKKYPFYGLQFHPEKNIYEWKIGKKIPHSKNAVLVSQYFANFFVNEARNNSNEFKSDEESGKLIYNYPTKYTALDGSLFTQCYLFKKKH